MKRRKMQPKTLIATLGSEPQVVTIVLDRLLAEGHRIDQTIVVYTAADVVQAAMARLAAEFDGAVYPGVRPRTTGGVGRLRADLCFERSNQAGIARFPRLCYT